MEYSIVVSASSAWSNMLALEYVPKKKGIVRNRADAIQIFNGTKRTVVSLDTISVIERD